MLQLFTNRKFLIGFGIITLLIFIVSLILKPPISLPEVIKTNPIDHSAKVNYFDSVTYVLDQDIDPNFLKLTSVPEEKWSITPKNSREIVFKSEQYLQVNAQYTLTLNYNDQPINTLVFTTLPQQSDPRYVQEVNNEIKQDYPLAVKTPLERPGFSAVYSKPLTLEITLKNGVEERGEILNTVRDWVKENGLDPNSHTYVFAN